MNEGIAAKVKAAGGTLVAVSSEPQALADRAARDWELDFETLGDPHHDVAETCRAKGWLDLFVNERMGFLRASAGGDDWEPSHPKGYFQPGVLAVAADGRVLYRWRSVPTHRNIGGAAARPTADYVWARVEEALAAGAEARDAALDADPPLDFAGIPWPIFSLLLISNGRFLHGRGFRSPRLIPIAAARLAAFALAWALAFAWLPTLPVAGALLAWVAYIAPKIRWLGVQFQDASAAPTPGA